MYRNEFVKKFGELMANACEYETCGVTEMEYDEDKEEVIVHFGDSSKRVDVSMDSCSAIMYDVIRYALW